MSTDKVNDHCSPSIRHVTCFWESPAIRIEILVLLAAVLFLFLAAFGSHRRRCRNWFIQKGVLGAYTLSSLLVTYTLGSMQFSAVKNNIYSVWAISLFILDGCTDSITSYSLDDNEHEARLVYQYLMCILYVTLLLPGGGFDAMILCGIAASNSARRLVACRMARHSWHLNKMVADYMYREHSMGELIPATMKGCHYLVDWPLGKSRMNATSYEIQITAHRNEVIDVDKVWQCNDRSLSPELKDVCLSFSLFHLLRRRFFGFTCGESKERAHDFVFKGLLSDNEDGATDYNRVFKVIEVELAFMYDFFFTRYAANYYGLRAATFWSLMKLAACIYLAACILVPKLAASTYFGPRNKVAVSATTTDVIISLLILASTALLEFLQLLLYWTTIWGRVSFVCQFLRGGSCSCMMRLQELLTKVGTYSASNKHCWQHKLGQYSLLESVSYPNPCRWKPLLRFWDVRETEIIRPFKDHAWWAKSESRKYIELPVQVKKALVDSLIRTDGKLTNGKSSLVFNRAECLLWACSQHRNSNISSIILTWHTATCYCEMATLAPHEGPDLNLHLDVATKLSKYCAYLVVYAPKLLPGHHYDTERMLDVVVGEACKFLASSRDKYETMRNLAESEDTIFQSGVKLGKQLHEIQDATRRWKVMADFWAEMMLYVAPSDNVREHIQQLAQGGEFITHLWALLSHAGILERDQQNPSPRHTENTQNSGDHQETEEDSASGETATYPNNLGLMSNNRLLVPVIDCDSDLPDSRNRTVADPLPTRWAPSPHVHASEIAPENEHRIDVPEASSSMEHTVHEQVVAPPWPVYRREEQERVPVGPLAEMYKHGLICTASLADRFCSCRKCSC